MAQSKKLKVPEATATGAAQRYEKLSAKRNSPLRRGRRCALLTIPALLPPDGFNEDSDLPVPSQSLGSYGVNNLASRMVLSLFPPGSPVHKEALDDFMLEQLSGSPDKRAAVEQALQKIERAVSLEIDSGNYRIGLNEVLKHLIVVGNILVYILPKGGMRFFPLSQYVVKRSPSGMLLEGVLKETMSCLELPDEVLALISNEEKKEDEKADTEDTHDIYTHFYFKKGMYHIYQEIQGKQIPGSVGKYKPEDMPWLALRYIPDAGNDYGRGYVEELEGDLSNYDGLSNSISEAAAISAKTIFLVSPNAIAKPKTLNEAENGQFVAGREGEVVTLRVDKAPDMAIPLQRLDKLESNLSKAFLLNSSVQRNGERVTAEEIRLMAQELESSLGGVYSSMATELQAPLVRVIKTNMTKAKKLPQLPEGTTKTIIVTGLEALGRLQDRQKLTQLLSDIAPLGPEAINENMNVSDFILRMANASQIPSAGLVFTEDQKAARNQQKQLLELIQKLGPNVINQMGAQSQAGANSSQPQ